MNPFSGIGRVSLKIRVSPEAGAIAWKEGILSVISAPILLKEKTQGKVFD